MKKLSVKRTCDIQNELAQAAHRIDMLIEQHPEMSNSEKLRLVTIANRLRTAADYAGLARQDMSEGESF